MSADEPRSLSIRRILVALDASSHSLAALETAAALAAALDAELTGLFVEDINLLRVAELPFAREMSLYSRAHRRLDLAELRLQLRALAGRARAALAAVAARHDIPWRFRVAHGAVPVEVLSASADADLIILGKVGWSLTSPRRMGSTVRVLVRQGRNLTLLLRKGDTLGLPVTVIYDGTTSASQKALAAAEHLVRSQDGLLSVIVLAEDGPSALRFREEAEHQLLGRGLSAGFRSLVRPSLAALAGVVQLQGNGPVVLPCGGELLHGDGVCDLADALPNPILLVR
jgi:nucleotide-binding universal stress UspA family protein